MKSTLLISVHEVLFLRKNLTRPLDLFIVLMMDSWAFLVNSSKFPSSSVTDARSLPCQ